MIRKIARNYFFSDNEINNILVATLKAKDIPAPEYVGNASTTRWTKEPNGIRVEWTDHDNDIEIS